MKQLLNTNKINLLLILGIIIYPLLWVPFGIDLTDTGHAIFYFKQAFSYPEVLSGSSPIILTSILGGLWLKLFPFMEYTSCKLAYALIFIFISFLLYKIFKDLFINKSLLLLSILLTSIYMSRYFVNFLNYSVISALFFVIAVYFLYRGITNKSWGNIIFSSVFLALNTFVRFPNILGISFVFAFFMWNFINLHAGNISKEEFKEEIKNSVKFSAIFLTGYFITTIVFILIMHLAGFLDFYIDGLKNLLFYAKSESNHSVWMLLNLYLKTYIKAILISLNFLGIAWSMYAIAKSNSQGKNFIYLWSYLFLIVVFLCITVLELYYPTGLEFRPLSLFLSTIKIISMNNFWLYLGMFLPLGIFLLIPILILLDKKTDARLRLLSLFGIILAFYTFAGSDGYFYNIPGYWAIALISVYCVLQPTNIKILSEENQIALSKSGIILVVFLAIYSVITKENCFYDCQTPSLLNSSINNNMFRGSYTTKERAAVLNDFINVSHKYIKKGDLLIALPSLPLIHYITETRPVFSHPWPACIDYSIFEKKLVEIEKQKKYPVIVRSRYKTDYKDWPQKLVDYPHNYVNNCDSLRNFDKGNCKQNQKIEDFISRNNYKLVWDDNYFEIYKK